MSTAAAPLPAGRRTAAAVALGCAIVDTGALLALHLVQPEVDPMTEPTSAYVHGTLGLLAPVTALAVGLGALALAWALRGLATGRAAVVALVLLAVVGVAKVVQSFFPIDEPGAPMTTGAVHEVTGNLAFFALPVAGVLLGQAVERATLSRVPLALGWLLVAAAAFVLAGEALGVFGLAQRLSLVLGSVWVITTALVLRATTSE